MQRYTGPAEERDVADTASYDRISQNGKIAVSGRQEAYADAALIDEANVALAALDRVRIRLEAGREVRIDGRVLRRVLPVFATREAAEEARTNPDHEPIAGEDAQTRQNKLASYRQSVVEPMRPLSAACWRTSPDSWTDAALTSGLSERFISGCSGSRWTPWARTGPPGTSRWTLPVTRPST